MTHKMKNTRYAGGYLFLAERVGFEPTVHCCITGFQDQLLKPLGHLSQERFQFSREHGKCQ